MSKVKKGIGGLKMWGTTTLPLGSVVMAPYNPRVMPPAMMRALKASLVKHGLVLNLVVQRRSEKYSPDNVLIGGHQRVAAMRDLCASKGWDVPEGVAVTVVDCDDAQAMQLNVALNNIEGDFDPYKLGEIFSAIRPEMNLEDVLATGFEAEQINEMIKLHSTVEEQLDELEKDIAGGIGGFAGSITLSVEFDTVKRRDEAKADLSAWAKERGVKPGVLLAEAVRAARAAGGGRKKAKRAA